MRLAAPPPCASRLRRRAPTSPQTPQHVPAHGVTRVMRIVSAQPTAGARAQRRLLVFGCAIAPVLGAFAFCAGATGAETTTAPAGAPEPVVATAAASASTGGPS